MERGGQRHRRGLISGIRHNRIHIHYFQAYHFLDILLSKFHTKSNQATTNDDNLTPD